MVERTVSVPTISCGHCVSTIEREVAELDGVDRVHADAAARTVTVAWNDAETSWSTVLDRLVEINYPPAGD